MRATRRCLAIPWAFLAACLLSTGRATAGAATGDGAAPRSGVAVGIFPDERIRAGGKERAYRLVVPTEAVRGGSAPLVFAFHGFRVDSKDVMPRYTRLDDLARREGFMLVYPNALEQRWRLRVQGNEDLDFFDALYQRLTTAYTVDAKRVYATGMSNGAQFANLLASQRSDRIAAIAPHSGTVWEVALRGGMRAKRKYPVMVIHGSADRIVPVEQARKVREMYLREGHEVIYVEVPGLGHRWATQANINDKIWAFFRVHPFR